MALAFDLSIDREEVPLFSDEGRVGAEASL
jgi:hypothetical protein